MLSIQQCETILNKNRKQKLTKQQVTEARTFLRLLAKISIQEYKKIKCTKRVVIMSRVSSDEQAKGFSFGVHLEQLTKYCNRKDIEIVVHYRNNHSAKDFNRP